MKIIPASLLVLAACFTTPQCKPPPPAPIPPTVDAAPPPPGKDIYDQACAVMASIGCPEGKTSDCAEVMRKVDNVILVLHPLCIVTCASPACVQQCTGDGIECGGSAEKTTPPMEARND